MLIAPRAADELRRAAVLDELRDQNGKHCAPESLYASFFAEPALRESGGLDTVLRVVKEEVTPPTPLPELQAPV